MNGWLFDASILAHLDVCLFFFFFGGAVGMHHKATRFGHDDMFPNLDKMETGPA